MPKTNNVTGATYAGHEGIVEHAAPLDDGRTLSELNPEKTFDGELIEGEHPDYDDKDAPEEAASDIVPIKEPAKSVSKNDARTTRR